MSVAETDPPAICRGIFQAEKPGINAPALSDGETDTLIAPLDKLLAEA